MSRPAWRKAAALALLAGLALGCGRGARESREGAGLPIEITAEHPVPSPRAAELEEAAPAPGRP